MFFQTHMKSNTILISSVLSSGGFLYHLLIPRVSKYYHHVSWVGVVHYFTGYSIGPFQLRYSSPSFLQDVLRLYFWCSLSGISINKTLNLPNLSPNFLLSAIFHLFVLLFYFLENILNFIFLSYSNFNFY